MWNQDQGHAQVTLHCAQVFLASWKQATSRDTRVGWLLTRIFQMHMIAAWGNEPCTPDTGGLYSDWVERYLVALQAPTAFMGCLAIVHVVFVVLLSIARNLRCASILLWNSERWQQCHAQLSVWCAQMDQGHARVCVWFSLCWMCLPNEPGEMQTWLHLAAGALCVCRMPKFLVDLQRVATAMANIYLTDLQVGLRGMGATRDASDVENTSSETSTLPTYTTPRSGSSAESVTSLRGQTNLRQNVDFSCSSTERSFGDVAALGSPCSMLVGTVDTANVVDRHCS